MLRHTIMLAEDDAILLIDLEVRLTELGHDVIAAVGTVEEAIDTLDGGTVPDLAILDVNLNGSRSFPIAERLTEMGVPVLFATGYGKQGLEAPFQNAPVLQKPFTDAMLKRAIDDLDISPRRDDQAVLAARSGQSQRS
ncbi:response regulator [Maricaulis sp. CAU 1757]